MEKSPLFENLINIPDSETRNATIENFANILGVACQPVHSLLTCYHIARSKNYNDLVLDLTFGSSVYYRTDAARILDTAGIRTVLVASESSAVLNVLHTFLSAGWKVSADTVTYIDGGNCPVLRLSRD